MVMSQRERPTDPALRPGYLFAAAIIWLAIAASLAAGPAPHPVQMAKLDCATR